MPRSSHPKRAASIEVRCSCGQVYHADPAHAGRAIRCRCGNVLPIRAEPAPPPQPSPPRRRRFRFPELFTRARLPRFRWPRLPRLVIRPIAISRRTAKILWLLCWGYLTATLVYTALLWLWGDAWWPATVLLFMPRWPALLPGPVLALTVVLIRPRLLVPIGIGVLVVLGPAMGYRTGWRKIFAPARPDLRIITFNLNAHENPRLSDIAKGLEPYEADILVFQECDERLISPGNWPSGWTVREDLDFCLISRFPVVEARKAESVATGEQGGTGLAMLYRVRTGQGMVDLAVIHLETPRKGLEPLRYGGEASGMALNVLVREVGSRRLSRWISQQSPAPIIAGDFNMPVESTIYRQYWGECPNAFSSVGHGFGWSRVLAHFSIRIDHVLTCGPWRPVRAQVGPDLGSDHLPLIVDVARVK